MADKVKLTKFRLTPLRRRLLKQAREYNLIALPPNEEKAAFELSKMGYLRPTTGLSDFAITPLGLSLIGGGE